LFQLLQFFHDVANLQHHGHDVAIMMLQNCKPIQTKHGHHIGRHFYAPNACGMWQICASRFALHFCPEQKKDSLLCKANILMPPFEHLQRTMGTSK